MGRDYRSGVATDALNAARAPVRVAAIVLGAGLLFAALVPPLGGYDEPLHLFRAWQVSDGGVFSRVHGSGRDRGAGGYLPAALVVDMAGLLRDGALRAHDAQHAFHHVGDAAPRGRRRFVTFSSAAEYSPVPYLPAALGIRIGRTLRLSTLVTIWLARACQIAAYAALIALALARAPVRRTALLVLALAPVALAQAATISADPITFGLVFVLLAEVVALATAATTSLRARALVEIGLVVCALALAKPPYVVLAALLLVPAWQHRGRVGAALLGATVAAAGLAVAWNHWAQQHFFPPPVPPGGVPPGSYAYHDVSPSRQQSFIVHHPQSFFAAIGRTIGARPWALVRDSVAQLPRWEAPMLIGAVMLAAVGLASCASPWPRATPAATVRVSGAVLALVTTIALFAVADEGWNTVGARRIDAFQGRYLLPVVAVLVVVCARGRGSRWTAPAAFAATAVASLGSAVFLTAHYYF